MWEIKDRSVAGLRIAATGGIGQSLSLGALVAVRQSDVDGWLLGVVRRLNKVSNEEVEAGVNIIAERMVAGDARCEAPRPTRTWATSSTGWTCRRWASASKGCICRRLRAPTSR